MQDNLNPYQPPAEGKKKLRKVRPSEDVLRSRYVASMWTCGICTVMVGGAPERFENENTVYLLPWTLALLILFWAGNVISAIALFRLPRRMDKLGAIFCVGIFLPFCLMPVANIIMRLFK